MRKISWKFAIKIGDNSKLSELDSFESKLLTESWGESNQKFNEPTKVAPSVHCRHQLNSHAASNERRKFKAFLLAKLTVISNGGIWVEKVDELQALHLKLIFSLKFNSFLCCCTNLGERAGGKCNWICLSSRHPGSTFHVPYNLIVAALRRNFTRHAELFH